MAIARTHILVCGGTGCSSSNSQALIDGLNKELTEKGLAGEVQVIKTGCFGLCALGPVVVVYPEGCFYRRVKLEDIPEIVDEHILKGRIVTRLLYQETVVDDKTVKNLNHTKFYEKQQRVALRNCGVINPENIDEYIAMDGYEALGRVLTQMTPDEVIQTIKDSGLRGRGGGGFPTGQKWFFARQSKGDVKYVCCNADEGDPGAFMDRSVLEGDPHVVLEAMTIAGYAIGANQGYIYIRAEYPIAVKRLQIAIRQAREYGLLGKNIFGTDFCFDVDVRLGAGAFVCGEGSAMTASIEGNRGMPRTKPPRSVDKGLYGKPTCLNNVETFANVPDIIKKGADWFKSVGTEGSSGTKAFALTGNVVNTGLIEVPMGTTMREVVYEIGGGIKNGKAFKAVQIGGPSGGCLTEAHMDLPMDFDSLKKAGAIIGSGGLVVMDEDTCMVSIAQFFMNFICNESCGKCTPCREGTTRMLDILTRITKGNGKPGDIEELRSLAKMIQNSSLCGLGKTAPNPVLSTLANFEDEYREHIFDKKCRTGSCRSLTTYVIDPAVCKGCTKCARNCPAGAITGELKKPHHIDPEKCIKCGACKAGCPFGAIKEA